LSYVFAVISAELSAIRKTSTTVVFVLGLLLMVSFPLWVRQRERSNEPALTPNALWKKTAFTSTCIMVTVAWRHELHGTFLQPVLLKRSGDFPAFHISSASAEYAGWHIH
jgi:hypothetical protein